MSNTVPPPIAPPAAPLPAPLPALAPPSTADLYAKLREAKRELRAVTEQRDQLGHAMGAIVQWKRLPRGVRDLAKESLRAVLEDVGAPRHFQGDRWFAWYDASGEVVFQQPGRIVLEEAA
jgi:hypothetical protein